MMAGGGSVVFHQFSGSISMCRTTKKKKEKCVPLSFVTAKERAGPVL
jgi:hypothetical protein